MCSVFHIYSITLKKLIGNVTGLVSLIGRTGCDVQIPKGLTLQFKYSRYLFTAPYRCSVEKWSAGSNVVLSTFSEWYTAHLYGVNRESVGFGSRQSLDSGAVEGD